MDPLNLDKTDCVDGKTTSFSDDGTTQCVDIPDVKPYSQLVVKDMSIIDYLSKPIMIAAGSWSNAQLQNTVLNTWVPSAYLRAALQWKNKIEGFALFRGTAVVKITLNSNPFQQGKLLLHFLPCEEDILPLDPSYVAMHNANITTKSTQLSVELDARNSSCLMKIPYIAPTQYIDINNVNMGIGRFYLSVLAPLRTGIAGVATTDYSIYISWEDVELTAPLVAQGPTGRKKRVTKSFKLDTIDEEVKKKGSVSGMLSAGATITSALTQVPFLSAIATPATMALDGLAGLAGWFGWSKPRVSTDIGIVSRQGNRYMSVCDGVDASIPLSLVADQRLALPTDASWTPVDEMSFNYLKVKPALVDTINWKVADLSTSSLYTKEVAPGNLYSSLIKTKGAFTTNSRTGPNIFYLHPLFTNWRGGIDVILKLVKTEYHTGRLQITWTPGQSPYKAINLDNSTLAMREIIDITVGDEIRLTLPFFSTASYLDPKVPSGKFEIIVLNELRAPETASQNLDILIYYCGAKDFEFQNTSGSDFIVPRVFSPQMDLGLDKEDGVIVDSGIANMPRLPLDLTYNRETVGESFNSLKQILGRYNQIYYSNNLSATTTDELQMWPWLAGVLYAQDTVPIGALAAPIAGGDVYSYLQPLYAFTHGGVSVLVKSTTTVTATTNRNSSVIASVNSGYLKLATGNVLQAVVTSSNLEASTPWSATAPAAGIGGSTPTYITDAGIGYTNVYVPGTSRTRLNLAVRQTTSGSVANFQSQQLPYLMLRGDDQFNNPHISRRFNDDFSLHYYVGTVPLFVTIA